MTRPQRRLILSADDFGMSQEVNEAIEQAHREGILTTASLMVAGPAIEDALRRARRLPHLRLGLHLVVIEGASLLNDPFITDQTGWFGRDQLRLGISYFFNPLKRKALKKEIEAQFRAFAASGLTLNHANAHKHMHLHPTIGALLIKTGLAYNLKAVRTPSEPAAPLHASPSLGNTALEQWTRLLRHQIKQAGMKTNDYCFGLRWSGHMVPDRIAGLIPNLPPGVSEIYFHPALRQNAEMARLMAGYEQEKELETLLSPQIRQVLKREQIASIGWDDL